MFNQEVYNKAPYDRLGDLTTSMKNQGNKFTAGRYLQALAMAKGDPVSAISIVENTKWLDRAQLIAALQKAAVSGMSTSDLAFQTVQDSFLDAMRSVSIPLALMPYMNAVPEQTRIYVNNSGEIAAEVLEGQSIPTVKGDWSTVLMTPRKFAAVSVKTVELVMSASPMAATAMTRDLAGAVGERENYGFVSPFASGSILYGATHFSCSGSAMANVDTDLKQLMGDVPFVSRKGCAFLMAEETATYLSLVRGSGGNLAYPTISPSGGSLCGLPVLISRACSDEYSPSGRVIGLVNPSQIYWSEEGGISLSTSTQAALQQDSAPSGSSQQVSMFQANAVALKCIKTSSWYVRPSASAYFVTTY